VGWCPYSLTECEEQKLEDQEYEEMKQSNLLGLLAGRRAIVTGASRGIGAAIATRLAASGAKVTINYHRNRNGADDVVREIRQNGGDALAVQADVSDVESSAELVSRASAAFGTPDVIVLNADAGGFVPSPVAEVSPDDYETRLTSELRLASVPVQAVLPMMKGLGRGSIIAVSSALCRYPVPGFSLISVSKASLEAYMRSLAVEVGPDGIRANVVEASMTETDNTEAIPKEQKRALVETIPFAGWGALKTSQELSRSSLLTLRSSSTERLSLLMADRSCSKQ